MIRGVSFLRFRMHVVFSGCLLALLFAAPGLAQIPVFPAIDDNGVDIATGGFVHTQTDVVIGQPGAGGLAYTRYYQSGPSAISTHNHNGYIYASGSICVVVLGSAVETFASSNCSGTFTSNQQNGSTLAYSGNYVYTMRDGTVAVFYTISSEAVFLNVPGGSATKAYLYSVTKPDGEVATYTYEDETVCYPDPSWCYIMFTYSRLKSVASNAGYRLWFSYPGSPVSLVQPNKVTGINQSVEYCVPGSCGQSWPAATYTYASGAFVATVTNALSHTTTYTYSGSLLTELQFPDNPNHDINLGYSSSRVSSVDLGFGTWTYAYSDSSGERTTTVTNPGSTTRTFVSTIASGRIKSITNELSQTVAYLYDGWFRPARVTLPEGNYTQYTRDGRGNVTQTRHVAKPGSGLADIVTSAVYPSYCGFATMCNKPTSTTDARGFRTDYTYNTTHGGVLTITAPAPSDSAPVGSGDRPQTRFTYAQFYARYLVGSSWVNGSAIWRTTVESACASGTSPSCIGTANETRTTTAYPGSGTANNVLPTSVTTAAGNGAVSSSSTMTYTNWSDINTVNGPLSGSADTARIYYDNMRRVTGVVGPDPDGGGGPLKHRAIRTTYNSIGQPTVVEQGTVTNQGDSAFSTFAVLQKQDTGYDQYARPVQSRAWSGTSIAALSQFSYDNRGRPLCSTVRMNPATFTSPPSDACTLGTTGSYGADRIGRTVYDSAGRVTQQQSAYGTALAQTTASYTYTSNGQAATLTDARSYRTTYEYDGYDRLTKLRYPHPSSPNQSSTTDYEQFTFDASGRPYQERRRSGDLFEFSWNNLGRITLRNAPGAQPDVSYGYDLLSRQTSMSQTGNTLTTAYDALSRVTSVASSVLNTVIYNYDAAGRRTRLTYPGSFYVTYSYNTAGDLTGILENGSASLATYAYDDLGRRTSLTRGNGVVTSYTFDALSRLGTLVQNASGTTYDTTFTFGYNPSSQITSRTRTKAVFDWTLPASFSDSYAANGLNKYTNVDGVTPTYDTRGNLTNDGSKTYGYDYDNRMITASGGVSLKYDPASRLHEVAGAATTRFLYDGADLIAEYNTSGTVLRRYVHGPGADEPLLWYEGSGTSDKRYLLADERGSVIGVTNGTGSVTSVNKYDAYGVQDSGNSGRFRYTGQIWLEDVGVYHYKARAYDPKLGRFLQTDPIGIAGGINLYAYVGNDPVSFSDPSGRCRRMLERALNNYRARYDVDSNMEEILVTAKDTSGECPEFDSFFDTDESLDDYVDELLRMLGVRARAASRGEQPTPSKLEKLGKCASDQLGLGELGELAAVAAGQPIPGTKPFVTPGSSRGTSVAGMAADAVFDDAKFPMRVPTIVGGPGTGRALTIAGTRSVARFAGRAVPIVGWVMLAYDAGSIGDCTFSN